VQNELRLANQRLASFLMPGKRVNTRMAPEMIASQVLQKVSHASSPNSIFIWQSLLNKISFEMVLG